MRLLHRENSGFTIVELLIVIVVIAILAAISIVAYNGIQQRANDTAVQSDINATIKHIQLYEANYGIPPAGGSYNGGNNQSAPGDDATSRIATRITQRAYMSGINQFYYCRSNVAPYLYGLVAQSSSGKVFAYTTRYGGWYENPSNWVFSSTAICPILTGQSSTANWDFSYGGSSGNWFAWVR